MASTVLLDLALCFIVVLTVTADTTNIRVGLYNYIPDLNDDKLASYKEMVENEFRQYSLNRGKDFEVDAVVNTSVYDPYAGVTVLEQSLVDGSFDMLEIDTVSLRKFSVHGVTTDC